MKILSIGAFSNYGESNTCLHRNWALKRIGNVTEVDTSYKYNILIGIVHHLYTRYKMSLSYIYAGINKEIEKDIQNDSYDIIWIDKGVQVSPTVLKNIKRIQSNSVLIGYSPDNMALRHNQSYNFCKGLKYYDYFVTTKSYTVEALKEMGGKECYFC